MRPSVARAAVGAMPAAARGADSVAALAALALLLPACGGWAGAPTGDACVLVRAAGAPPPALVDERPVAGPDGVATYRTVAADGTLAVTDGGDYTLALHLELTVDGVRVPPASWRDRGRVDASPAGLRFTSSWLDGLAFDGRRTAGGFELHYDLRHVVGETLVVPLVFGCGG